MSVETTYKTLQSIMVTLDEVRAILETATEYSTEDSEKAKVNLTPLLMAAGDLLEKAFDTASDLETELNEEVVESVEAESDEAEPGEETAG